MLGPFSIDTFFPAFRAMGADFGVSAAAMQQTISVYLIAYAGMSLFHGPISDAYGRRRPIIAFTLLFALASAGCALAPSFHGLLAFRALQGVAAGAGLIVGRAIIRDRFAGPDAQRLMSHITLIFGVAPALAPVVGGWLLGLGGWRSLFALLAAFSVLVALWCLLALPETHPAKARSPFAARPLARLYGRMLRDRLTRRLILATMFNFGALFLYIASAPALILDVLQLNERQFAWLFVPAIGGMMTGALLSGRLAGRRTPIQTVGLAYRLMALGTVVNLGVALLLAPGLPWTVLPIGLVGIGISCAFPTLALLLLDRYPDHRGAASSLQAFFMLLFNAMTAGLLAPLLAHHPLALAGAAAALSLLGFMVWRMALGLLPPA
ncbi:Bcr/CflA family efflux MFS transporter [Stagnimonas aquatica]|uniref:Bcr/CflA family efflux transporter n=2 Tax=Stagnimonas aquatica TaxID=2689987 RepID=A0A3N0V8Y2_9GAMM|nr:Bcr/CflA family efflux MFS transporter [Stagnimonas aquatica]